jgi:uncharacterized protein (TIGR00369 family)
MAETPAAGWLVSLDSIRRSYSGGGRGEGGTELFGVELVEVDRGRTVFRLPITARVGGGVNGGVHGGVIAALVDIGVVCATLSACGANDQMRGTAELNVSYLRPAVGEALIATTTIIKKGGSLAVGDVDVHNDRGSLVAKGRATYALGRAAGASQP